MEVQKKSIITPKTMTLYSGREVDIFNVKLEDIDVEDLAHAMSNLCRFGGHTLFHYSVAQHSVLCSYYGDTNKEKLENLMHDTSESFVNDLIRPIKHTPEFAYYREVEDKIQEIIFNKFKLSFPMSEKVHYADNRVLREEMRQLIINKSEIAAKSMEEEVSLREALKILRDEKLRNCTITKMHPEEAKELFLNRFYELYEK